MANYIKIGADWKTIVNYFVHAGGSFKGLINGWINIAGVWKSFFEATLAPQSTVIISQSTNGTTYLTTLTGTNYYWSPGPPSLTYRFQWWNGVSWSDISTGSAINPAYGSSTSYTQLLQSTGPSVYVQPNQVNRFRFKVDATYGPQSASSISSETTIQGPTSVTLTAGAAALTSIDLSWTASTGANRYMIYYSTNNSVFTLFGGAPSTSVTVTGLVPATLYYFKVIPITGSSNDTGYYGSYSNTVSQTTSAGSALTPTFGANTSTADGFTGSVTNYDSAYNWNTPSNGSFTLTNGTWTWGTASGSTRPFTVTGLSASQSSTATVTTTRTDYASGSADTTGTASALPQYTVTWGANGGTGGGSTGPFDSGTAHTAPSPGTRAGYTFNGYYDAPTGDYLYGPIDSGGSFTPTANTNMTARWSVNPITPSITMAANSGVSATAGTINWTSTNQASFSSTGTFSATGTIATSITNATGGTAMYEIGPITTTGYSKLLITANLSMIAASANEIQLTVGSYIATGATAAQSTNVPSNTTGISIPYSSSSSSVYFMATTTTVSGQSASLCGTAIDSPGAGTFYYRIWASSVPAMSSNTTITANLNVLQM